MSFYFQPPIFAVRPRGVAVGGWVYACPPAAWVSQPMPVVYAPAAPAVHATSCVPVLQQTVYLPAPPAPPAAAPPPTAELAAAAAARLTIRIVFHGRSPPPARTLWCRIADARYARAPSAARLRADAALFAEQHGIPSYRGGGDDGSPARLYVLRGGARLAVHAGAGAVVTRAVERAVDLTHGTAAVVADLLEGVLRGQAGGRSVFLVVDVDGDAGGLQVDHVMEVTTVQDEAPEEPAPEEPQVNGHDVDGDPDPEPAGSGVQQVHIDAA